MSTTTSMRSLGARARGDVEAPDQRQLRVVGLGLELGEHRVVEVGGDLLDLVGHHRLAADLEVGDHLGAERLDVLDRRVQPAFARRAGLDRRVLEVLGPDAHGDRAADVAVEVGWVGQRVGLEAQELVAEVGDEVAVLAVQLRLEEVHRRAADEARHEQVGRRVVELHRRVDLLQHAAAHQRDAVAHRHRLDLVVGDVDGRRLQLVLDAGDLGAHLDAQLRVEVAQRLVHQEDLRAAHDRAAHRHALALTAGERLGLALEQVLEPDHLRDLADALLDLGLAQLLDLEPVRHVVVHAQVRVERVVLEHHRDVALLRRDVVDHRVVDHQLSLADVLEPREHSQGRGLAAARRTDQDHELPVPDLQIQGVNSLEAIVIDLRDAVERHARHVQPSLL